MKKQANVAVDGRIHWAGICPDCNSILHIKNFKKINHFVFFEFCCSQCQNVFDAVHYNMKANSQIKFPYRDAIDSDSNSFERKSHIGLAEGGGEFAFFCPHCDSKMFAKYYHAKSKDSYSEHISFFLRCRCGHHHGRKIYRKYMDDNWRFSKTNFPNEELS